MNDKEKSLKWYTSRGLSVYMLILILAFLQGLGDARFMIYGISPCEEKIKTIEYFFPTYRLGCLLGEK